MRPVRTLGALLAVVGIWLLWINRLWPDESRWLGAATLVGGAALALLPETRARRGVAQVVASGWLVLVGGELAVLHENAAAQAAFADRLIHFVDDPELRYELKPNVPCEATTTNDLGMVDAPRAVAKPPGTFRVACLGDSVGADCSLARQAACGVLETILRDRRGGRPTETLNFSVFGYNTLQEARSLEEKAAGFAPDAIVIFYVVNDPFPELAVSHFLPGHLKFEHLLYSGAYLAATRTLKGFEPLPGLRRLYEEPRAWDDVVVAGFDRIARAAASLNAPVVVAVFPVFLDPPSAVYDDLYAKVAREADRHGMVGLDLARTAYRDASPGELLKPSRDAIHPNALAHRLAAEAIANALVAREPRIVER